MEDLSETFNEEMKKKKDKSVMKNSVSEIKNILEGTLLGCLSQLSD